MKVRTMSRWYYTVGQMLLYVAVFQVWQTFPVRSMFVLGAGVTIGVMTAGMVWSARRGYFANRTDLMLHALVIVDVGLEGSAYEIVRLVTTWLFDAHGSVASFHDRHNFYICAAAFAMLVGGYHGWAIRGRDRAGDPQTRGEIPMLGEPSHGDEALSRGGVRDPLFSHEPGMVPP
jgi:hypothetical protein